ncbi:MAG: FadD3 family acyl-CoA ligase [Myxococcota bacterium]
MTDPAQERTLPRMVAAAVARYGDRPAIEDSDTRYSFRELGAAAERVGRALVASGCQHGDRVSIWAPNVAEWVVAAIGIQSIGAVLVPLSTRHKGAEAAYQLQKSGARWLFTVAGFLDTDYVGMLEGQDLPDLEGLVLLRGEDPRATSFGAFLAQGDATSDEAFRARADAVSPDDMLDMLFTSGTTGKPKGVMTDHGQNLAVFETWSGLISLCDDDRYLVVAPFFHTFGYKAGWLSSVMRGATIVPQAVFDAEDVLQRIERERITVMPGAPTIYQSLLSVPDWQRFDLSSLRAATTGAAAIPVALIRQMKEELGFDLVLTAYGLTESCGTVSMCEPDDDPETIANTSGKPIPGVEVRCVDPDGKDVKPGEPGEIWVRGFNVMRGYFDAAEQTKETITADGWLRTGDIGVMDARGYLQITDRLKDMFIMGGFNCYPAEIENLMFSHDAIAQVAVIGVPDERMGEVGMAFVVPAPGHTPDADGLIAWCREQMANYKVPRRVEIVDALPINAGGKVDKVALRARAAA